MFYAFEIYLCKYIEKQSFVRAWHCDEANFKGMLAKLCEMRLNATNDIIAKSDKNTRIHFTTSSI